MHTFAAEVEEDDGHADVVLPSVERRAAAAKVWTEPREEAAPPAQNPRTPAAAPAGTPAAAPGGTPAAESPAAPRTTRRDSRAQSATKAVAAAAAAPVEVEQAGAQATRSRKRGR